MTCFDCAPFTMYSAVGKCSHRPYALRMVCTDLTRQTCTRHVTKGTDPLCWKGGKGFCFTFREGLLERRGILFIRCATTKQYYDTKQNKHRHHHDHVIVDDDDDDGAQTSPRCPLGHWRATGLFMYANSIPCATVGYSSLPYRSTPRAARQTYEQCQSNSNCSYNKQFGWCKQFIQTQHRIKYGDSRCLS